MGNKDDILADQEHENREALLLAQQKPWQRQSGNYTMVRIGLKQEPESQAPMKQTMYPASPPQRLISNMSNNIARTSCIFLYVRLST
jgi:hypothetical protein